MSRVDAFAVGAGMSATDALLSCAAAETVEELLAARFALLSTGVRAYEPLDCSGLVSGDGTAGAALLGTYGAAPGGATCASRSTRIRARLHSQIAAGVER